MAQEIILESTITCPECGHIKTEIMPTDACQWFYECENCHTVLIKLNQIGTLTETVAAVRMAYAAVR